MPVARPSSETVLLAGARRMTPTSIILTAMAPVWATTPALAAKIPDGSVRLRRRRRPVGGESSCARIAVARANALLAVADKGAVAWPVAVAVAKESPLPLPIRLSPSGDDDEDEDDDASIAIAARSGLSSITRIPGATDNAARSNFSTRSTSLCSLSSAARSASNIALVTSATSACIWTFVATSSTSRRATSLCSFEMVDALGAARWRGVMDAPRLWLGAVEGRLAGESVRERRRVNALGGGGGSIVAPMLSCAPELYTERGPVATDVDVEAAEEDEGVGSVMGDEADAVPVGDGNNVCSPPTSENFVCVFGRRGRGMEGGGERGGGVVLSVPLTGFPLTVVVGNWRLGFSFSGEEEALITTAAAIAPLAVLPELVVDGRGVVSITSGERGILRLLSDDFFAVRGPGLLLGLEPGLLFSFSESVLVSCTLSSSLALTLPFSAEDEERTDTDEADAVAAEAVLNG